MEKVLDTIHRIIIREITWPNNFFSKYKKEFVFGEIVNKNSIQEMGTVWSVKIKYQDVVFLNQCRNRQSVCERCGLCIWNINMFLLGLPRVVLESSIRLLIFLLCWKACGDILDPLNTSFFIFKKEFRWIANHST